MRKCRFQWAYHEWYTVAYGSQDQAFKGENQPKVEIGLQPISQSVLWTK